MNVIDSPIYRESVLNIARDFDLIKGSVLVTGATGLIGSCIVDVLLAAEKPDGTEGSLGENAAERCKIYALGRNAEKLRKRFSYAADRVNFIVQDIKEPLPDENFDYIFHCASNADPRSYALQPAETVTTNVIGTYNILNYCKSHRETRLLYTSTFEVYGQLDKDIYEEADFGLIDQNQIRSGYPESKRVCEIMLRSYTQEYGIDALIARLSSIYGPTMLDNDSKAHAQFIRNALKGQDIVLKSEGLQKRTYCYAADAVRGLFTVLRYGKSGEAYNVANPDSVVSIAQLARIAAELSGTKVVFDLPDDIEKKGFSKPQNCVLDTKKLEMLGFKGSYDIRKGMSETMNILKEAGQRQRSD